MLIYPSQSARYMLLSSESQKREKIRQEQQIAEDKGDYKTAAEKANEALESIKREQKQYERT